MLWFFSQGRWGVENSKLTFNTALTLHLLQALHKTANYTHCSPRCTQKAHSQHWRCSSPPNCALHRTPNRSHYLHQPHWRRRNFANLQRLSSGLYWVKGIPWTRVQNYDDYYYVKYWTPCIFYQETWRSKYRGTENPANATKKESETTDHVRITPLSPLQFCFKKTKVVGTWSLVLDAKVEAHLHHQHCFIVSIFQYKPLCEPHTCPTL